MNYSGKFDATFPVDDSALHSDGHVHVDTFSAHATHAPADAIVVPDAHLLFNGDFKRSGVDLVLSKDDQELVLHDYFKGEKRAALASPDGAHLTGDIVNALTGQVEYAQADGSAGVSKIIGHVTKLAGTATAVRNGVSIILNQGDNVEKGDVVQSGSGSTLGITFIDGTVFGLSSNARMVLNELVYDPNGSNNSSLLSLVAGTITFVAGETAKHGDMKIDTPVATMGIRGTAVLVEIDFDVPSQGGLPDAKFQVLVEPDGTTGSYILFDKTTLTPLAIVDKAGQQINISNGTLTQSSTGLSSDIQKLITDVFSIKFTDTNTKTFDHHTDTPIPDALLPIRLANGITAIPVLVQVNTPVNTLSSNSFVLPSPLQHINQAPSAIILGPNGQSATNFPITERPGATHSSALDTASGTVSFVDINVGDDPTVSTKFVSFTYQNAAHTDVTATLNALQLADIAAVEANLVVVADPGNKNTGSATWTYSVADGAFDFLAAGETLTLTYDAAVNNNYLPSDLVTTVKFTITITGTNDVPVITTGPQTINFSGGTSTQGGDLAPSSATPGVNLIHAPGTLTYKESGTLTFTDPDLTDTHSIVPTGLTGDLTGASLSGTTLDLATLESKFPGPFQIFEHALSASIAKDSTGTGTGTINWTFAELPAYVADFIPRGETLTLTYTVEVEDSQGAIATQNVIVNITGSNAPAVVWIASVPQGAPPGGLWSDASDWETGTVPTATDDVIIITDQLIGLTPSYPVTIDATTAAVAKTVTLNDFSDLGNAHPQLINRGTLTVGSTFSLGADSTVDNFGTITVGGLIEVSNTSVLQNSNQITLQDGGYFKDQSSITNSGTIEISGGMLDVEVAVANSGGIIKVDGGSTLKLNGAAINGGAITDNGTIDVTANSSINGIIAGAPPVTTNALLKNGGVTIESGVKLTLDDVTVTGTTFTDTASGAVIQVDDGTKLTLSGVTIHGGTINDGTASGTGNPTVFGSIDVTGNSTISNASLNHGGVTVANGVKLTLDNDTVTGTTFTDTASGATIQVDDGTTLTLNGVMINGGTINDGTAGGTTIASGTVLGDIDVTGNSTISNASLNHGGVTIASGVTLTLDNVTVTGTTVTEEVSGSIIQIDSGGATLEGGATIEGTSTAHGAINNSGTIEVAGAASLIDDMLTNSASGSIIQVDDHQTLTLSGTEIIGGTINDSSPSGTGGTIDVTGDSKIDSNASLNNGYVTIESGKILTLDNVTVTGTSIEVDGAVNTLVGQLIVQDGTTISGSHLTIDGGDQMVLNNATITGGTITDNGKIDVTGNSSINGVTAGLVTTDAILNNGGVTIESGVTLKLDNVTVNGSVFTDVATSSIIQVDSGDTLAFNGATINGGTIDINGVLDSTGISFITGATIVNVHNIDVTSGTLTIDPTPVTNTGTIEVSGDSTLVLEGEAITNSVTTAGVTTNGIIQVDADLTHAATLDLDGSTINGGTVTISGELVSTGTSFVTGAAITNSGIVDVTSGTGTISGTTSFVNSGTVEANGAELDLVNTTVTNTNGTVEAIGTGVLKFQNATINGGTLGGSGTIATATGNTDSTLNGVTIAAATLVAAALGTLDLTGIITNKGEIDATTGTLDLENAIINGGTLGGSGTIATATGNTDSTLNGVTIASGSKVTAAVGALDLTGTITNRGEIDATTGTLDLENATINGGTLGGPGTIETVSGADTLNGVTVASGATVTVTDNTVLDLIGTIADSGTIALNSSGHNTQLKISGNVVLNGGGHVTLTDNASNSIVSDGSTAKLTNFDTIAGAGTIGDTHLTLVNNGTIDATGTHSLTIDTGTNTATSAGPAGSHWTVGSLTVTNNAGGILEASAGHTLQIDDNVQNNGLIKAGNSGDSSGAVVNVTGNITGTGSIELFNYSKLEIGGSVSFGQTVTFGLAGAAATLILDDSHDFHGTIDGLVEASNDSLENHVDLKDLAYRPGHMFAFFVGFLDTVIVGNGKDFVTLQLSGSPSDPSFALSADGTGGTLMHDPSASSGMVTIDSGQTLDISVASTATVSFTNSNGNTGELVLDNSHAFTGQIAGFAGDGTTANSDLIDLSDVNIADVATDKTTYTDNGNGTGTLTLHDANGQALDSISFAGNYQLANFTIENDGNGHTLIVDPPVPSATATVQGPGPAATSTVVASAPNQTLTGNAASDTFAFNFANVGHATVTDFHPATDTLQFNSQLFANIQAALNATHDDGHGNTVVALDAHDTITLSGVLKAQLHASDFHFV